MKQTHKTRLLSYLKTYKCITTLQAIKDLGNTRLSAYIFALRKDGYNIINDNIILVSFLRISNKYIKL